MRLRDRHLLLALTWLLATCVASLAQAGAPVRIAVIVGATAPKMALNRDALRDIYLKKIFVDDGGHRLIPVNLPPASPLREAFTHSLIRMPDNLLQNYWNRQYFQGVSPPYVLASQQAVVRFVASTPGAIGYIASCFVKPGVHVALWLTLPADSPAFDDGCPAAPTH
ncbi:hypothetical protein [Dyella sp. A6]|uniref:hypothetical protein n=1 Tax=Dyella aluminiiresistens TaxID=3069105 RepID=UPI002E789DDF|nr:hypothetical protein [Dyella sp. A6]